MTGRREFIAFLAAGAACSAFAAWGKSSALPRARVGLLTDTHITDDPGSCKLVGEAFRLFRREKIDTILHAGDLAGVWSPAGYREYRRLFHEVFAGCEPREIFSYGQHDGVNFSEELKSGQKWYDVKWPAFAAAMESGQSYKTVTTLGGFPLVVYPENYWENDEEDQLLRLVDETVKAHPNGPVFVLRHRPAAGTTRNSERFGCWCGDKARMAKYPNVIMLTGHTHGNLYDEATIWQEGFTSVDLGTLEWPRLHCVGMPIKIHQQHCVMSMDVFDDRAEFTRWNLRTGREIGEKWVVPWGLRPELLGTEARRTRERTGHFDPTARAVAESDGKGGWLVRFPEVLDSASVHRYEVRAEVGGRTVAVVGVRGPWYSENCESSPPEARFRSGLFAVGDEMRFKVVPITFLGKCGPTLETDRVVQPAESGIGEVWQGKPEVEKVATHPCGYMFHLPKEACKGKKGTHFRVSMSLVADGGGSLSVYSDLRRRIVGWSVTALYAEGGTDREPLEYVLDFVSERDDDRFSLYFYETMATFARLAQVKVVKVLNLSQK